MMACANLLFPTAHFTFTEAILCGSVGPRVCSDVQSQLMLWFIIANDQSTKDYTSEI